MIIHIVLLHVTSQIEQSAVSAILEELGGLRYTSIPEIKAFSYGENCSPEGLARGYNYGFTMQFESKADRDHYLQHPEHINIAKKIGLILESGIDSALAFDYSVD